MPINDYLDFFNNDDYLADVPAVEVGSPAVGDMYDSSTGSTVINITQSGSLQYIHLQPTPANGATITHNLGRLVSNVFVEDTAGNDWAATIQNIDNNTTYIYIGQTMAFTAILT